MNTNKIDPSKSKKNEKLLKKYLCRIEENDNAKNLCKHHIESFDYAMNVVLKKLPKYIRPLEIKSTEKTEKIFKTLVISYEDLELGLPVLDTQFSFKSNNVLYPHQCREREMNYSAPLYATIKRKFDNDYGESVKILLGNIPIMVGSKFCNLRGMSSEELVKMKEDPHDSGGYFIINGIEKLIRMISLSRRNYPIGFM